jgi:hypothetical protein
VHIITVKSVKLTYPWFFIDFITYGLEEIKKELCKKRNGGAIGVV